jgi:hypothetical protein
LWRFSVGLRNCPGLAPVTLAQKVWAASTSALSWMQTLKVRSLRGVPAASRNCRKKQISEGSRAVADGSKDRLDLTQGLALTAQ